MVPTAAYLNLTRIVDSNQQGVYLLKVYPIFKPYPRYMTSIQLIVTTKQARVYGTFY